MSLRIVSLVPSATELLCAIPGGRELLVGRSHECDHPPSVAALPVLTAARTTFASSAQVDAQVRAQVAAGASLYTLDHQLLTALRPDLILTQDLCSVCSIDLASVRAVAAALNPAPRLLSLNPQTLEDVLDDLIRIGQAAGLDNAALAAAVGLRERLYAAADFVNAFDDGPNVAFLEWTDPLFIGGHWTPQLIERAGGRHPLNPTIPRPSSGAAEGPVGVTQRRAGKSIAIPVDALVASRPERLVICPCGLTLEQARREADSLAAQPWFASLPAVRQGQVAIVDGNQMFNRPGPRLVDAFCWLVGWLNHRPQVIPVGFPWSRHPQP